ncbi:MAG: hypothetical protein JWP65_3569 [Ramlibacter sp.]|jgi:hypothetical protein|uniref:DUF3306 domain-containing protein n=1 Tax=Ramlibacter sp. TaxID=1917967 RepID=UPI0026145FA1|nr:DUF3306 domain-containing protein [Ramlibacter sp.]MDB5753148.1 hypothetical protein [Ramlibacter sp.]
MADGFLGRWAKRKEAVRKGQALPPEPVVVPPQPAPRPARAGVSESEGEGEIAKAQVESPPPPTLEDVESLTPASDFSRYVQPDVGPDVRNAAMKKLFADPHFNVMDRLDIYIDDYSQSEPIPEDWLRQMASTKFLKLFDDKEEEQQQADDGKVPTGREAADVPPAQTVAQSRTADAIPAAVPPADDHADPDLRLQQDDAPGPAGPGTRA